MGSMFVMHGIDKALRIVPGIDIGHAVDFGGEGNCLYHAWPATQRSAWAVAASNANGSAKLHVRGSLGLQARCLSQISRAQHAAETRARWDPAAQLAAARDSAHASVGTVP